MSKIKEDGIFGSYLFVNYANKGKLEKVRRVLKEYRKTAKAIADFLWREFFEKGYFPHKKSIKKEQMQHIQSKLSERYKYVCLWQVYGVLEGYIANLQNQFARIVWRSTLLREDKLILLALNNIKGWLRYEKESITIYDNGEQREVEVKAWHKHLAKKIFKHLLGNNRRPRFEGISLHLDGKVAELEPRRENKAKAFDYWLKLSTLDKGKPVLIPLKKNPYAESLEGEFRNFYQILEEDGRLKVRVVKELKKRNYVPATDTVAIDLGLNPLIATNSGDLMGRQFFDFLKKMDEKIVKRMARVQRNGGLPSKDTKYREYVRRLREFLKNEINRVLNRLINLYKPMKLVVERLDFRSAELSKRMNRLIQNFGKRYVKEKLERMHQLYGIEIVEANPAYSSQECSSCGYVDRENRKSTQEFECKCCGNKINAQVNSAKNLLERSSLREFHPNLPKKQVLKVLIQRHLERLKGCKSPPLDILKGNPYYREFLENILNPRQGPLGYV
jgi:putative transposase